MLSNAGSQQHSDDRHSLSSSQRRRSWSRFAVMAVFCFWQQGGVSPTTAFSVLPAAWQSNSPSHKQAVITRIHRGSGGGTFTSSISSTQLHGKDWDKILAEEEDDQNDNSSSPNKENIPFDMRYNLRNCQRAQQTFQAIRQAGPGAPAADVYGRDRGAAVSTSQSPQQPPEAVFWFLGKVAHVSDVSLEECVARQWPLIQQHAANLRPLDLFPAVTSGQLELWCATPPDSELDVAYNRPGVVFTKMEQDVPGADKIKTSLIGFRGEVYEGGEEGFRTWRSAVDGSRTRPELTGVPSQEEEEPAAAAAGEVLDRPPTDDEMKRLEEMLQGRDINELYEEQERRKQQEEGK